MTTALTSTRLHFLILGTVPLFQSVSSLQWNLTLTWEDQVSYNNVFSVFGIADLWEVGVDYEEDNTSQEGQDSDSDPVAAGAVVFIEHALDLLLGWLVNVAFCRDGCKDHDGKQLQRKDT